MRSVRPPATALGLPIVVSLWLATWPIRVAVAQGTQTVTPLSLKPDQASGSPSAAELLRRLDAVPRGRLSRDERALRAGLAFCAAVRRADGHGAFPLIEAIGYQPLPLAGPLPIEPGRPVRPETVARLIDQRPAGAFEFPAGCFRIADRRAVRKRFEGISRWMLPGDRALLIDPPPDRVANWLDRPACLVVRVRGRSATIVGGNLFAAIESSSGGDKPQP